MIPSDLLERRKIIKYMLAGCVDNTDSLSSWEEDFINSINEQFSEKENLTDKQCEILEKIYDKIS